MKQYQTYVGVLFLGIVFGVVGMYVAFLPLDGGSQEEVILLKTPAVASKVSGTKDDTVIFSNDEYGFSFHYPKGLVTKEFEPEKKSLTMVFQKPGEKIGFQMFVTPYSGGTITGERILEDVPSGIVRDLQEENLRDDLLVATFTSEAPLTGETREIWFLHGGSLYEFTAYAGAEEILRKVLLSIEFHD